MCMPSLALGLMVMWYRTPSLADSPGRPHALPGRDTRRLLPRLLAALLRVLMNSPFRPRRWRGQASYS